MQFINDFPLKYKLAGMILPGLLVILFYSSQRIIEKHEMVKEYARIEEYVAFAMDISSLVHELQKERGVTVRYLAAKGGAKLEPELAAQRMLVNKELANYRKKMEAIHPKEFEQPIKAVEETLGKLADFRKTASKQEIGANIHATVEFYSQLDDKLIDIIAAMPRHIHNAKIANRFLGLFAAEHYKEPMGVQRAILSSVFALDHFGPGMYLKFLEAVGAQEANRKFYFSVMLNENLKAFEEFLKNDIAKKATEMVDGAVFKADEGKFGVDPAEWARLQTEKINLFNDAVITTQVMTDLLAVTDEQSREANSSLAATVEITSAIIIMTAFITIFLTMGILQTIRETTRVIGEIAQGDFTKEVNVKSRDEMGVLATAVNVHVLNMGAVLDGVNDMTTRVNTSANEIAASVSEQASISTEQSASLSEITATMEELSASSSQIAENANSVAQLSKNMLAETDRSVVSLGSLKGKMDEIEADNKKSINEILELDRKSKEIGKIMGIINNIADQTKMIAFNAAIEASSAGEAGKRFSVVAGEIRRLADNVMESTGEIQGKIEEIQKAVNRLVIVSEKGEKTVRDGANSATTTLEDLKHIVVGTKSTTESAIQISLATQQQKTASNQVLIALKEIDQGMHHSSAAIRQTSATTTTMTDMAENLQKILGKFKTKGKTQLEKGSMTAVW
jgi:methyl-accepting chemotaxis protein